jgi:hypothetical protein
LEFHSGREADHSTPSGAEVKKWVELYLHSPNAPSWRGVQLGEHRDDNFYLYMNVICYCHLQAPELCHTVMYLSTYFVL